MKHQQSRVILAGCILFMMTSTAQATSLQRMNLTDMISLSEIVVVAEVVGLTDGFDGNGLPYTEVSVNVTESLKGGVNGTYSFRQFGLLAPRDLGNGRTFVGVSPDGWPRFAVGQKTILFLYATTSLGFQSTTGLMQGKFNLENGFASNAIDNAELFSGVISDRQMLSEDELKMLEMTSGPVRTGTLKSFVAKAVQHGWQN